MLKIHEKMKIVVDKTAFVTIISAVLRERFFDSWG